MKVFPFLLIVLCHAHGVLLQRCTDSRKYPKFVRANNILHYEAHPNPLLGVSEVFRSEVVDRIGMKETTELPLCERTNSIQDFCFMTDIFKAKAITPVEMGNGTDDCYKVSPPATVSHSGGADQYYSILEHLSAHFAQSYQPYNDLPFVDTHYWNNSFLEINPNYTYDGLPSPRAPNPYFVEVTGISVNGELLQNFLHFRIFANLSVVLPPNFNSRKDVIHGRYNSPDIPNEKPNYVTGKISAALIMVKDQDGYPVGDFSLPIPCAKTCTKYSHDVYYGDKRNALPCSFTPPYAHSHPGMFVFDVDPGRYCTQKYSQKKEVEETDPAETTTTTTTAAGQNPPSTSPPTPKPPPADPRYYPQKSRLEGVREVHATWSFGHTTCNFVRRLYIQTLIFEDVETVYEAYILPAEPPPPPPVPNQPPPPLPNRTFDKTNVLFGWSAQYNIIKTTRSTLGAPDYVDLKYLRELDRTKNAIDCHVPLWDSKDAVPSGFQKFLVPSTKLLLDVQKDIENTIEDEIKVPSAQLFLGHMNLLHSRIPTFGKRRNFGQFGLIYPKSERDSVCRDLPSEFLLSGTDKQADFSEVRPERLSTFLLEQRGLRCPCPALASTLAPINRTVAPERLYSRILHAEHMTIAYMLLTPIACFVARYYKETFNTLFCFQEYWWYMWHVVILFTACMFNIGALTTVIRGKGKHEWYMPPRTDQINLWVHYALGVISICVFYLECVTGFFRSSDPKVRMRNIFMHWLIGCVNNACAVGSMVAMAWQEDSGFSCKGAYTSIAWLIFVVAMYVIMELNMRKTNKKLRLVPKRTYLPPPVKRLFTREPPGRVFRLVMLLIFIIGLVIIECFVIYFLRLNIEGGQSCVQELHPKPPPVQPSDEYEEEEAEDDDEAPDY